MHDILNSDWLLKMLEKSGKTPRVRMLALFDILDDWLNAPRVSIAKDPMDTRPSAYPDLLMYLRQQAEILDVSEPQLLANQVCLMALAAAREKQEQLDTRSFSQAKLAADALISAQARSQTAWLKPSIYAGFTLILGFVIGLSTHVWQNTHNLPALSVSQVSTAASPPVAEAVSPEQTAALFAQIEYMRKGNCQLLEALQLPDSYKEIYFENIVLGHISTDPAEQKIVRNLLEKVRCNYTPMLMANSRS